MLRMPSRGNGRILCLLFRKQRKKQKFDSEVCDSKCEHVAAAAGREVLLHGEWGLHAEQSGTA
eukprot:12403080-Karenia_brevis.AAC.1